MQTQRGKMILSGIAFVPRQAVLRIDQIPFGHQAVAFNLREDGSSRNGDGTRIAVNQRFLFDQRVNPHRIQQQIIGSNFQQCESFDHCLPAGLVNIPRVDTARVHFCHAPRESMLADAHRQNFAALGGQFLRIIEANDAPLGVQYHRRSHHRPEQ